MDAAAAPAEAEPVVPQVIAEASAETPAMPQSLREDAASAPEPQSMPQGVREDAAPPEPETRVHSYAALPQAVREASMPHLVHEASSSDDESDNDMPPLEDGDAGDVRYVSQREAEDSDGLVIDVRHSLGRLTRLSARMRSLRDQAIWQREATTTVTELLAAAADLESLAEERMRLLRTVTALRRKPKRHVPENYLEKLPDVVLDDAMREEPCPICLCRLDGKDAEAAQPHAKTPPMRLPCTCKRTFHRACVERWLRTKNTCPTCRYELPYEEEPEVNVEVEDDDENEAQRLADGEVAATAAAREAAASLVELAAYDAMTHAEENITPVRARTARAAAAAAALREVAAEPPLRPSFAQQRASLRRRATREAAGVVREANAPLGNHLDTIRGLRQGYAPEASAPVPAASGLAAARALRADVVDPLTASPARLRALAAAARPVEAPAS